MCMCAVCCIHIWSVADRMRSLSVITLFAPTCMSNIYIYINRYAMCQWYSIEIHNNTQPNQCRRHCVYVCARLIVCKNMSHAHQSNVKQTKVIICQAKTQNNNSQNKTIRPIQSYQYDIYLLIHFGCCAQHMHTDARSFFAYVYNFPSNESGKILYYTTKRQCKQNFQNSQSGGKKFFFKQFGYFRGRPADFFAICPCLSLLLRFNSSGCTSAMEMKIQIRCTNWAGFIELFYHLLAARPVECRRRRFFCALPCCFACLRRW